MYVRPPRLVNDSSFCEEREKERCVVGAFQLLQKRPRGLGNSSWSAWKRCRTVLWSLKLQLRELQGPGVLQERCTP